MTARSAKAEVRNPVLAVPEAIAALEQLEPAAAEALARVLTALASDWQQRAEQLWRKHKAPMAAYWKVNAVWARHIARAIRSRQRQGELI